MILRFKRLCCSKGTNKYCVNELFEGEFLTLRFNGSFKELKGEFSLGVQTNVLFVSRILYLVTESHPPPQLYADVFAVGLVDKLCACADGGAVVVVGVREVCKNGKFRIDVPLASGGDV